MRAYIKHEACAGMARVCAVYASSKQDSNKIPLCLTYSMCPNSTPYILFTCGQDYQNKRSRSPHDYKVRLQSHILRWLKDFHRIFRVIRLSPFGIDFQMISEPSMIVYADSADPTWLTASTESVHTKDTHGSSVTFSASSCSYHILWNFEAI